MTDERYISSNRLENMIECAHVNKDIEAIKKAIKNIQYTSSTPAQFLGWACKEGLYEVVKVLLDEHTYKKITYKNGEDLEQACMHGHLDIVKLLINYGANPKKNKNKAIKQASHQGQNIVIKYLHEIGCNINEPDIISDAVEKGNISILEYLIKNAIPLTNYENRIFLNIVHENNIDLLNFTKKHNIPLVDDNLSTYVGLAAQLGHIHVVKELTTTDSHWHNILSKADPYIKKELLLYKNALFEQKILNEDIKDIKKVIPKPQKI